MFLFANEEDATGKVNIDELYERNHRRNLRQISIFNKILNRVHTRIRVTAANKFNNEKHIWFQVPAFIFGESVYDQSSCVAYVITKLEENGFFIKYIHPGTLFVSWENWLPNYARQEIRKRTGMVLDSRGQLIRKEENDSTTDNTNNNNDGRGNGDPLYPSSSSTDTTAAAAANRKNVSYKAISEYKPTGNLVYGKDLMESLDKKVRFSL